MKAFFVTGTDTGVGKTYSTCALTRALRSAGHSVSVLKPIAAGCEYVNGRWLNDDGLALQQAAQNDQDYTSVNPIALPAGVAPHIAAQEAGERLTVASVVTVTEATRNRGDEILLIEGAGGFLVPLNEQESFADYVVALQVPVILVVGMRLGCINHALLSAAAIRQRGLRLAGWIANSPQAKMERHSENVALLRHQLGAPLMAELDWQCSHPEQAFSATLSMLLE